jgi:hypothetical protein
MLDGQSVVTKRVSCDVFCSRIAVRLFLCIFTPFDTTRRSDGIGRLRARRRLGYSGEQNGQSVLRVAAGYRLLQNQNRIVRVGSSIRSLATPSHYFVRQPTICCDLARRCSSRNDRLWNVLDCKTTMNQSDHAEQIESPAFWRKALNRTVDRLQIKSSYR